MKHTVLLLLIGLGVLACVPEGRSLPIPVEKAAKIIIDVHAAESALQNVYGTKKDSLTKVYYDQIYTIYEIDSTELSDLILLIREEPKILQEVYSKALIEIEEFK